MTDLATHLPVLQVVVPLLLAPLVVLLRPRGLAWAAATAGSVMALLIAVNLAVAVLGGTDVRYELGGWSPPYGIALRVDAFSALLLLIVTGASSAALLAARRSIDAAIETHRQPLFYASWLLALAGLAGILVSADAFNIFVFMEISSLASYILVAGGPDRRALPAVFKYLIMGTIGATFYLIGVGLVYMMTGTLNLADMELRIHEVADQRPILVAAGFITVGLALKAAVFPLHVWLPNAYTYAPHAVTVFLAACATKVSLYVLMRFDFIVFQQNLAGHEAQFAAFLMPLAVLAILVGSAVALFENNLKRLLAYSSVAQIGYILLGVSMVTVAGLSAGVLHMFNHALAKGALFLAVMCLATRFSGLDLNQLAGAARRMPWTMAALVLAGLGLIGVPGTAGFISKWYLVTAALNEGPLGFFLVAVVVAGSLMAVVYVWRIVEAAWFATPATADGPGDEPAPREAPVVMLLVTWAVALANVFFGLVTGTQRELAERAAGALLGGAP
ncbi:MAG: monovalent cation/H+ antiporter subunit D family protein [Xanthomonadales bacterium]